MDKGKPPGGRRLKKMRGRGRVRDDVQENVRKMEDDDGLRRRMATSIALQGMYSQGRRKYIDVYIFVRDGGGGSDLVNAFGQAENIKTQEREIGWLESKQDGGMRRVE